MAEATYGESLRAKGIGHLRGGVTRDKVVDGVDSEGARTKTTIDQLGNEVTEHNNSKDQVDVKIVAPTVYKTTVTKEVRDA